MKSKQITILFWLFTAALFIGMVFPDLFSDGMFMDGLIYANVSRNLAEGIGSFWDLHLSETVFTHFHEHPPLAMGMQSMFFYIIGDSIFTERIYCLFTAIITAYIIVLIWKKVTDKEYHHFSWLPVLFWINFPILSWSVENNMLENTMMIFTALSVLFILISLHKHRFLLLLLSGLMIFFGFLTKGFVALFPLSFIFIVWLIKKEINFGRAVIDSLVLTAAFMLPFVFLYMFLPEGIDSIKTYINNQVIGSIENVATVNNRFSILGQFAMQLSPIFAFMLLIFFLTRRKKFTHTLKIKKTYSLIFFILSLSGILPMIVSMKQRAFYLTAALPFAALSLALIILPYAVFLSEKIFSQKKNLQIFKIITVVLLIASISFSAIKFNTPERDKELITDVRMIIETVPERSVISANITEFDSWSLQNYLNRYAHICLDDNKQNLHDYFLIRKATDFENKKLYKIVKTDMKLYDLYIKAKD